MRKSWIDQFQKISFMAGKAVKSGVLKLFVLIFTSCGQAFPVISPSTPESESPVSAPSGSGSNPPTSSAVPDIPSGVQPAPNATRSGVPEVPEVKAPKPPDERGVAFELGLQVVSGVTKDHHSKDFNLEKSTPLDYEMICQKDRIAFGKVFQLTKDLFFVWPHTFQGRSILFVTVNHVVMDGNTSWEEPERTQFVAFEAKQGKWLLSVFELIQDSEQARGIKASGSETHILKVALTLAESARLEIHIYFRVRNSIQIEGHSSDQSKPLFKGKN